MILPVDFTFLDPNSRVVSWHSCSADLIFDSVAHRVPSLFPSNHFPLNSRGFNIFNGHSKTTSNSSLPAPIDSSHISGRTPAGRLTTAMIMMREAIVNLEQAYFRLNRTNVNYSITNSRPEQRFDDLLASRAYASTQNRQHQLLMSYLHE